MSYLKIVLLPLSFAFVLMSGCDSKTSEVDTAKQPYCDELKGSDRILAMSCRKR
ncbi:MAG: hypothetical protein HQL49_13555 [Gammaproteobacteria bacterium]|nr:hypothetical protein [Gammaproteobacteria bacterium]